MNKQKIFLVIGSTFLFLFIFFISSCSTERIDSQDEFNSYESPNQYLNSKKEGEQVFVIDTNGTGPIVGQDSTLIWISKHILEFPNGDEVEWPYTVKLIELYTAQEMIYYQMPTVSQGKIMETGGEIRVRAFKENSQGIVKELRLKEDRTLRIDMPSDSTVENMNVFYGYDSNGAPNWTTSSAAVGGNPADDFFSTTLIGYRANIGKLGWINCGKTMQGHNDISFTSETDHLENVAFFTYLPEYNSVLKAQNLSSGGIPDSTKVKIIGIAVNADNELFNSYIESTINSDGSFNIIMQATTDLELSELLFSF